MKRNDSVRLIIVCCMLTLLFFLMTACQSNMADSAPAATVLLTAVPPTSTPIPPTLTSTPLSPTSTPTPLPPTATPTALPALNPSRRGHFSMAYDEESDRIILFGGLRVADNNWREASLFDGETWAYDAASNTWTEMHPASGPRPRIAVGMTYDAKADRIILFGGVYPGEWGRDETWAYDYNTNTWQQMASGPAAHMGCRIAYDAESDRIILFGGYDYLNDTFFNDTWAYDYNADTWTEMAPSASPSARNLFAMAYDAESDRVLVWGQDRPEPDAASMWAYDYNNDTWQEMISDGGPTRNIRLSMAYNVKADRIVLQSDADTWAYDYNTNQWTNLAPAQTVGMRSKYDLVYSTAADRVILFGGSKSSSAFNDETWVYDFEANVWTDVTLRP